MSQCFIDLVMYTSCLISPVSESCVENLGTKLTFTLIVKYCSVLPTAQPHPQLSSQVLYTTFRELNTYLDSTLLLGASTGLPTTTSSD